MSELKQVATANRGRHGRAGKPACPPKVMSFASGGVKPAVQTRSKATYSALIRAGQKALEGGSLEEMRISDLVRDAGTSVGAFYGRFENKTVFFFAVQAFTLSALEDRLRAMFDDLVGRQANAVKILTALAPFWVSVYRNNRGLYKAAFRHQTVSPELWTPFKVFGYTGSELLVQHLLPRLAQLGIACDAMRIRAAMQFVNGLLVNATINDPGPVRLDDPEMEAHILRFLCTFLGMPAPDASVVTASPTNVDPAASQE